MMVKFKDVAENTLFSKDGVEFKKIQLVKISCCKTINAIQVLDPRNRVLFNQEDEVEVNDQL
jgi:hypothetical protein